MSLVSPGVQVKVFDESQYVVSAQGTVPFVLIVTAENKLAYDGVGIAQGTTAANANKLYLITSQRDLLDNFGFPEFTDNGAETNEYGLLAAYSALGQANLCYVLRADIDLSQLLGSLNRPTGKLQDGSYWENLDTTNYGINTWNCGSLTFSNQPATLISSVSQMTNPSSNQPAASVGKIGDFAYSIPNANNSIPVLWQKVGYSGSNGGIQTGTPAFVDYRNTWQKPGTAPWLSQTATVTSTKPGPFLVNPSSYWVTNLNGTTITVPSDVSTLAQLVYQINKRNIPGIFATYTSAPNPVNQNVAWYFNLYIDNSVHPYNYSTGENGVFMTGLWMDDFGITTQTATSGPTRNIYFAPTIAQSTSSNVPLWAPGQNFPRASGSVWQITNNVTVPGGGKGTSIKMLKYNSTLSSFLPVDCQTFNSDSEAIYGLDPTGGGQNIPVGTLYNNCNADDPYGTSFASYTTQILYRWATGPTIIQGTVQNATTSHTYTMSVYGTQPGRTSWYGPSLNSGYASYTVTDLTATGFVQAINTMAIPYVSAYIDDNNYIVVQHSTGGSIQITITAGLTSFSVMSDFGLTSSPGSRNIRSSEVPDYYFQIFSNWTANTNIFTYQALSTTPTVAPPNDTQWYWEDPTQADIMINTNSGWQGYKNVTKDYRNYNLTLTNASGPQFSPTAPTTQTNGNPLALGDLWIDTSDLDNYPVLYRWQGATANVGVWTLIDDQDQTSPNGIVFADARWAPNGTTNPATDPIPNIASMLVSNYLDLDAPSASLYPQGTLLFNTRRSSYNVKSYQANYFNAYNFPDASLPTVPSTWLTISGTFFGRKAQRTLIVAAMKSAVDTNISLREEQNNFTLLAAPQYPELTPNLIALNNERGDTAFTVVDTPLRLSPADVVEWATNNGGLGLPSGDGLVARDAYAGAWYPSCTTSDLGGNIVVTCPSHMILRTLIHSDQESYPWIASAGTRRGLVDNATGIGYLDSKTNAFVPLSVDQGLRDVLYLNQVNPITFMPGTGIVNFGNKTLQGTATALDRVNVARLVAYLRGKLKTATEPFLFEPNDEITRNTVTAVVESLMVDLIVKRAIYDYAVVCDLSNNTAYRIDNNELWVDVAIQPVKAVEFIYIPLRIKSTGALNAGA